MTPIQTVLGKFPNAKREGAGWKDCCPAHTDKTPSLSIAEGNDGRVLLHCFAGCKVAAILGALGLKEVDLFEPRQNTNGKHRSRIVATYDYQDEFGALLYQVVRYEPKNFRQRCRDARGGWNWETKGVRRVLFQLPLVQSADDLFLCEGEKDCLALMKLGFLATTKAGGGSAWKPEYSEMLRDKVVFIWGDNDSTGRKYAEQVIRSLSGAAKKVFQINVEDKDPADFIQRLGDGARSAIDRLINQAVRRGLVSAGPNNPGDTLPGNEEPETGGEIDVPCWAPLFEDGAAICAMEAAPPVEIVGGLLTEQSKFVIASGAKANKTWLTIDLAVSISAGVPFLGRSTRRIKVLYANLELKSSTFRRRIQLITTAKGVNLEPAWFTHLPLRGAIGSTPVVVTVSRLIELAKRVGAGVVVLDPIYKLNTEGEENSSRDQTRLFNEIDRLTTEAGVSVILCDHFSKGSQADKDPLDAIRGSSAKGGDVDAAVVLRKHETEGCFSVDVIHRELAPIDPFVIEWRFPLMQPRSDLDAANMKRPGPKPKHDILELLRHIEHTNQSNPISVSRWADVAGIKRETLNSYITTMRQNGWIATSGEGTKARKFITLKGKEALVGDIRKETPPRDNS